jgi:hypothetical protein
LEQLVMEVAKLPTESMIWGGARAIIAHHFGTLDNPVARDQLAGDIAQFVFRLINAAINDKLEEVAAELDKLAQGTYTTAQTPAGLVRAMKVKGNQS